MRQNRRIVYIAQTAENSATLRLFDNLGDSRRGAVKPEKPCGIQPSVFLDFLRRYSREASRFIDRQNLPLLQQRKQIKECGSWSANVKDRAIWPWRRRQDFLFLFAYSSLHSFLSWLVHCAQGKKRHTPRPPVSSPRQSPRIDAESALLP